MAFKPLVGNEIFLVYGQQPNNQPAATTFHTTTGLVSNAPLIPVAGGSATTLTETTSANTLLFSAATGTVFTLPAATGSGVRFKFVTTVTVTSNFHKILPASVSDFIQGIISTEDSGTMTGWYSDGSANHSISMNGSTTGGFIGDNLELIDVATGMWQATGTTKSTGTAATPFSTATT